MKKLFSLLLVLTLMYGCQKDGQLSDTVDISTKTHDELSSQRDLILKQLNKANWGTIISNTQQVIAKYNMLSGKSGDPNFNDKFGQIRFGDYIQFERLNGTRMVLWPIVKEKRVEKLLVSFSKPIENHHRTFVYDLEYSQDPKLNLSAFLNETLANILMFYGRKYSKSRNVLEYLPDGCYEVISCDCDTGWGLREIDCGSIYINGGDDSDFGDPYDGSGDVSIYIHDDYNTGGGGTYTGNDIDDAIDRFELKLLTIKESYGTPKSVLVAKILQIRDILSRRRTDYPEAYEFYSTVAPYINNYASNLPYSDIYDVYSKGVDIVHEIVYQTLSRSIRNVANIAKRFITYALFDYSFGLGNQIFKALPKAFPSLVTSTGVIWKRMTNLGPNYLNSYVPTYFRLKTRSGKTFEVLESATEHLYEMVKRGGTSDANKLRTQFILDDAEKAINSVTRYSYKYETKLYYGRWEIMINKPTTLNHDVIYHLQPVR